MEKKIIKNLEDLDMPKELLENPAIKRELKKVLEENYSTGDWALEKLGDVFKLGRCIYDEELQRYKEYNSNRFVEFNKNGTEFIDSHSEDSDIPGNGADVKEKVSFDNNGILNRYVKEFYCYGPLDGGLNSRNIYEANNRGYINSEDNSYIDFGFVSPEDLFKFGILTKSKYGDNNKTSMTAVMKKFDEYSNQVKSEYPNFKDFYESKKLEILDVLKGECLNPDSLISFSEDERKSLGITDCEIETVKEKLSDKDTKIAELMNLVESSQKRLNTVLGFIEKVKRSPFGKFFFKKELKQLPSSDKDENIK